MRRWKSIGATEEHAAEGPPPAAVLSNTRIEVAERVTLPAGLRTALLARLQAANAALDRGDAGSVLNVLNAVCNQVRAQSGKAIPEFTAERWISLLQSIDVEVLMARQ